MIFRKFIAACAVFAATLGMLPSAGFAQTSSVNVLVSDGVVQIVGTSGPESIRITQAGDVLSIQGVGGTQVSLDGAPGVTQISLPVPHALRVLGRGGSDSIVVDGVSLRNRLVVRAGSGTDEVTIRNSQARNAILAGGNGEDSLNLANNQFPKLKSFGFQSEPPAAPTPTPQPPATPTPQPPATPTPTPQPPTGPPSGDAAAQREVLALTNQARAENGCPALSLNTQLNVAADAHSEDMAARNYFSHTSPEGEGPGERLAAAGYDGRGWGENIAAGQSSAEAAVTGWMNSPGHRANILNCNYDELGVGFAEGGQFGTYWTQVFGTSS